METMLVVFANEGREQDNDLDNFPFKIINTLRRPLSKCFACGFHYITNIERPSFANHHESYVALRILPAFYVSSKHGKRACRISDSDAAL